MIVKVKLHSPFSFSLLGKFLGSFEVVSRAPGFLQPYLTIGVSPPHPSGGFEQPPQLSKRVVVDRGERTATGSASFPTRDESPMLEVVFLLAIESKDRGALRQNWCRRSRMIFITQKFFQSKYNVAYL